MSCIDVDYREVVEPSSVKTENGIEIKLLGPVAESRQPKHIGFGYIIHAPGAALLNIPKETLVELSKKGMWATGAKPLFLRTETPFVKIGFHRGDTRTALEVYQLLNSVSHSVYKNWI